MTKIEHAILRIQEAKQAVTEEIDRETNETERIATIYQLNAIRKKLEDMECNILNETLPPKASRNQGMAHMITDSWPLDSLLGSKIILAEDVYVHL